jgi:Cdc6-like AAA superfamily ATPase
MERICEITENFDPPILRAMRTAQKTKIANIFQELESLSLKNSKSGLLLLIQSSGFEVHLISNDNFLVGGPGVGKSVISSQLHQRFLQQSIAYFNYSGSLELNDFPEYFLKNLVRHSTTLK